MDRKTDRERNADEWIIGQTEKDRQRKKCRRMDNRTDRERQNEKDRMRKTE
jgi:hypothetical protein